MTKEIVKGWKNTDKDLKCRNFQFKVGESYHQDGDISLCNKGFHFHENRFDIFKFYDKKSFVVEVEASGEIVTGDDKSVCSDIKIIRILEDDEVKELCNLVSNIGLHNSGYKNSGYKNSGYMNSGHWNLGNSNSGHWNSGYMNSGNRNSGDWNSGNSNSGHWNSGYMNSGDKNSGDKNSGYMNSGHMNSGHWNSGYMNSGDKNSGYWNSGYMNSGNWNKSNYNTGCFNTKDITTILTFNKNCKKEKWDNAKKPNFIYFNSTLWITEQDMTKQEKKDHPEFYCLKGYLKTLTYKDAWKISWDNKADDDIELLEALPNFSWKVFTEISGIEKPK